MKHVIIGTAGHVDHGKTLLVKALTGIDTDRLVEEKKRGITIELGFAHLDFDDGTQAGIVDVPGHEKFIKNMLAGAGGIDLAMLVVAADEGFMPQTVEHLGILSLLGIRDGLVVITKADMVDPEWIEMVKDDVRAQVEGTFLEGKPVFTVSAYTGQGIPELRQALKELVQKAAEKNMRTPSACPSTGYSPWTASALWSPAPSSKAAWPRGTWRRFCPPAWRPGCAICRSTARTWKPPLPGSGWR